MICHKTLRCVVLRRKITRLANSNYVRFCSNNSEATISKQPRVLITGGAGNLGTKAAERMAKCGADVHVLDPWAPTTPVKNVQYHAHDMVSLDGWPQLLDDMDTVVHLACCNPYPGCTWVESADSMSVNMNMMSEAAKRGVPRFVFASSNHVMGGYKELGGPYGNVGVGGSAGAPPLRPTEMPVEVGTKWQAGGAWHDSMSYAVAKLAGERMAEYLGQTSSTQFISLRIGWCQPGDNRPESMSATGGGRNAEAVGAAERATAVYPNDSYYDEQTILDWYRLMWLSNRDYQQIIERCVYATLPDDVAGHVVLNANSENDFSRWDVNETKRVLGYIPEDNLAREAKIVPPWMQ
eukprot:m.41186 g.41186  ORF g.41186 m.41186 type:complete len:351 (+) comp14900_c0_seq2:173-1225(+)